MIDTWLVEEYGFWCATDGDLNAIGFATEEEAVAALKRMLETDRRLASGQAIKNMPVVPVEVDNETH